MKLKFILCASAFFLLVCAQAQNISIKKGKITIGKTVVTPYWKIEDFKKGFGSKAGYVEGWTNVKHLENIGVQLYENDITDTIGEVNVYMSLTDGTLKSSIGTFKAKFKIDGKEITQNTSSAELESLLTQWTKAETFGDHYYKYISNGIYLYAQYTVDEKTIFTLSFGKIKKRN